MVFSEATPPVDDGSLDVDACLPPSLEDFSFSSYGQTDTHTNHIPGLQSAAIANGMEDLRLLIFVTLNPTIPCNDLYQARST